MTDHDDLELEDDSRLTEADQVVLASRRAAAAPVDAQGYRRTCVDGAPMRYGSPDIVTTAPCRNCKAPVEVTETGMFTFKTSSAYLVSQGEAPLRPDQVMVCDACRVLLRDHLAKQGRKVVDKLAWCFRVLRDGGTQEEEREAITYLDRNDNERAGAEGSATVKYWLEKRAQKQRGRKDEY